MRQVQRLRNNHVTTSIPKPPIYCEASDLLRLPPLSLDPVGEQVQCNSQNLKTLTSVVERLESKLSSFLASPIQQSYAKATSAVSHAMTPVLSPVASHSQSSLSGPLHKSTSKSSFQDSRESNVVLFGVPENQSIVEVKSVVDEVFEFLSGKQIQIKDMFRLGRLQQLSSSSPRPRPLLCTVWDRKLILLRKTNLRDFHIKRLFLHEDVAPDHKLRQKRSAPSQSNALVSDHSPPTSVAVKYSSAISYHSPPTSVAVESSSANASVSIPAHRTSKPALHSGTLQSQQRSSSVPSSDARRSASPAALSRSVSPSPASIASSSTTIQGSDGSHNGSA